MVQFSWAAVFEPLGARVGRTVCCLSGSFDGRLRLRLTPVRSVGPLGSLRCAAPGARHCGLRRASCPEPDMHRRLGVSIVILVKLLILFLY